MKFKFNHSEEEYVDSIGITDEELTDVIRRIEPVFSKSKSMSRMTEQLFENFSKEELCVAMIQLAGNMMQLKSIVKEKIIDAIKNSEDDELDDKLNSLL
jgi:hypothetical protein